MISSFQCVWGFSIMDVKEGGSMNHWRKISDSITNVNGRSINDTMMCSITSLRSKINIFHWIVSSSVDFIIQSSNTPTSVNWQTCLRSLPKFTCSKMCVSMISKVSKKNSLTTNVSYLVINCKNIPRFLAYESEFVKQSVWIRHWFVNNQS